MKISIIGAGSSYTPELIEKFAEVSESLPVKNITLMDIDLKRLDTVYSYCLRYARHIGLKSEINCTDNLDEAVYGSSFVNTQIRVGGNLGRIKDEKIPLSMGIIGQETTGPGGFMKALRTIPAMLEISDSILHNAPDAWMINYANPTGIISQALHDHTDVKCAALCAGGLRPAWNVSRALGVNADDVRYDMFGLNHLNYAYNISIRGRPITRSEFEKVAAGEDPVLSDISIKIGALLSGYLQYYYRRRKTLEKLQNSEKTRGEEVLELEKDIYDDFLNPGITGKPDSLAKRGGGGYSQVAVGVMDAIHNNRDMWHVINVPNNGVFKFLPDNAVVETAVIVNAGGIKPIIADPPPKAVWGLVSMVKNYEMLTSEAAVTGDYDTALLALMHHPLVADHDTAKELFDKMLEANKEHLQRFFR